MSKTNSKYVSLIEKGLYRYLYTNQIDKYLDILKKTTIPVFSNWRLYIEGGKKTTGIVISDINTVIAEDAVDNLFLQSIRDDSIDKKVVNENVNFILNLEEKDKMNFFFGFLEHCSHPDIDALSDILDVNIANKFFIDLFDFVLHKNNIYKGSKSQMYLLNYNVMLVKPGGGDLEEAGLDLIKSRLKTSFRNSSTKSNTAFIEQVDKIKRISEIPVVSDYIYDNTKEIVLSHSFENQIPIDLFFCMADKFNKEVVREIFLTDFLNTAKMSVLDPAWPYKIMPYTEILLRNGTLDKGDLPNSTIFNDFFEDLGEIQVKDIDRSPKFPYRDDMTVLSMYEAIEDSFILNDLSGAAIILKKYSDYIDVLNAMPVSNKEISAEVINSDGELVDCFSMADVSGGEKREINLITLYYDYTGGDRGEVRDILVELASKSSELSKEPSPNLISCLTVRDQSGSHDKIRSIFAKRLFKSLPTEESFVDKILTVGDYEFIDGVIQSGIKNKRDDRMSALLLNISMMIALDEGRDQYKNKEDFLGLIKKNKELLQTEKMNELINSFTKEVIPADPSRKNNYRP